MWPLLFVCIGLIAVIVHLVITHEAQRVSLNRLATKALNKQRVYTEYLHRAVVMLSNHDSIMLMDALEKELKDLAD